MNKTKFAKLAASMVLAAALCAMVVLTGCMPKAEQQPDAASLHRAYMSNVNSICAQAAEDLDGFSDAAASGDLAAMRVAANTACATLNRIGDLEVPEDLAEVHGEYLKGAQELAQSLQDYVALYGRFVNETYDSEEDRAAAEQEFQAGLADIQALYDSGLGHLSTADSMVAELGNADTASE